MTREEWDKLTPDEQWAAFNKRVEPLTTIASGWIASNWPSHTSVFNGSITEFKPLVDDKGNPPPANLCGDMFPHWEDGQWWTCWSSLMEHRKKKEAESK